MLDQIFEISNNQKLIEIVHQDGEIKTSLNGVLIGGVAKGGHEFTEAGHIGFQSEGAPVHFRNIRIKEL